MLKQRNWDTILPGIVKCDFFCQSVEHIETFQTWIWVFRKFNEPETLKRFFKFLKSKVETGMDTCVWGTLFEARGDAKQSLLAILILKKKRKENETK